MLCECHCSTVLSSVHWLLASYHRFHVNCYCRVHIQWCQLSACAVWALPFHCHFVCPLTTTKLPQIPWWLWSPLLIHLMTLRLPCDQSQVLVIRTVLSILVPPLVLYHCLLHAHPCLPWRKIPPPISTCILLITSKPVTLACTLQPLTLLCRQSFSWVARLGTFWFRWTQVKTLLNCCSVVSLKLTGKIFSWLLMVATHCWILLTTVSLTLNWLVNLSLFSATPTLLWPIPTSVLSSLTSRCSKG